MISLAAIRIFGVVLAASTAAILIYMVLDAYGDHRVAQERARVDRAIAITNTETGEHNETDEATLALAEKMRVAAVAAARKLPKTNQCALTADEATAIGAIR